VIPLLLMACSSELTPIEGTTIRVGKRERGKAELLMRIYRDNEECNGGQLNEDIELCPPFVDRASGQVRFAFQPRIKDDEIAWPMILEKEDIGVWHNKSRIPISDIQLTGHEPVPTAQLYILLMDVSGSMEIKDDSNGPRRIDKIRSALLKESVINAFFPSGTNTAVVPLVFSSGNPQPLGASLVVDNPADYKKTLQQLDAGVKVGKGYTHLYNAISYASSALLEAAEIKGKLEGQSAMSPTVIALTDGFNNEDDIRPDNRQGGRDTCRDNVPRLQKVVSLLEEIHRKSAVNVRPTVYTVGLGKQSRKSMKKLRNAEENDKLPDVTASLLCGAFANRLINGDVERYGVDNVALAWLAAAGHGKSYIKQDSRGLADAFVDAASKKFRWYDVRYSVNPFFLRRTFKSRINFIWGSNEQMGSLEVAPSGWLDGPPGIPFDGRWVKAAPYSRTAVLIFPLIGLITTLMYLPAAMFNLRRILFNRIRKRR
jgi:hypothetical protein